MTKNYVEENEKILADWKQEYKNRGKNINFVPDGIMFRGDFAQCDNGIWYRKKSGKENQLWSECPLRILYLTKDQNAGDVHDDYWDCRGGSLHKPYSNKEDYILNRKTAFNENLAKSLYGLVTTKPNKFVEFKNIEEKEVVKVCDEYPFAQINCKKEAGGSTCPYPILIEAIKEYGPFLKQQILNLDADIFVCCGEQKNGFNPSLNFLNEIGYNFKYTNDNSYAIHYDEQKNKIAICAYHLGHRYSRQAMYEDIVKTYYVFLQEHRDFIKSHRK